MNRRTSANFSHVSSGQDERRVSPSKNPVRMTDLQRRLMAGKEGILELALLRESHRILIEEAKNLLEDQSKRKTDIVEHKRQTRSQRSVSESCDVAPEFSSSDEEEADVSFSIDDVFCDNPSISNRRNISSCSNTCLLATVPSRLPSTTSTKTKLRRMSEVQCRGLAPNGRPSFCRTFNEIWLTPHRCQSEGGSCLRFQARPSRDLCFTDAYRKPVILSGLTFNFPSPLHAVLSQFDFTRRRCCLGPAPGRSVHRLSEGWTGGSSGSNQLQGKGVGLQQGDLIGPSKRGTRESERILLHSHRTGLTLSESESSLFHSQHTRVRLGEIALLYPQSRKLFFKTIEEGDLDETLTTISCASSNVEERSSEDCSNRQESVLEPCPSEDKDPEELKNRGFDLWKTAVTRPYLARTTLYNLSEEGYFSGSESQPGTQPEPPPRRRRKGGSKACPRNHSFEVAGMMMTSTEDLDELTSKPKPETGTGPCAVQSETRTERSASERLPVFC